MSFKLDNAIIMAAGTSSRFAPLSYERPKALIEVRGEILLERQIRQLREAGIPEIVVVTGYKAEQLQYLAGRFGVRLVHNPDYLSRNNNASIWAVRDLLRNSYICSADNYFAENPFNAEEEDACYAAVYAPGETREWCMTEDAAGYIDSVTVGGRNAWYMLGHSFWSEPFSRAFLEILTRVYREPRTADQLWESIFMEHLDRLKMRIRRYPADLIFEFDTLDELRDFDPSYVTDTRSQILRSIAAALGCTEADIRDLRPLRAGGNAAAGIRFLAAGREYEYAYETKKLKEKL